MNCINHDQCGNQVEPNNQITYWEGIVYFRHRDAGGPNRRGLHPTGQGFCPQCSTRLEHNMPTGQETLV